MRIHRSVLFVAKQTTKTAVRKTITATLALTVIASSVLFGQNILTTPQTANAITPPDTCFAFTTVANQVTITDYYNNEANNGANPACPRAVDIPATLGGNPVVQIGAGAFPGPFMSKSLTSVTIPEGVTSIGNYAFYYNQLASVNIPASVTSIGGSAFQNNQLTSVTIPSSVTSIGSYAFYSNQLTSLIIPGSVTSIGGGAFSNNQLASVNIPASVTSIGDSAFYVNQLTSVTIPDGVTSIGDSAFSYNQLTSVTFEGPVTTFGSSIFNTNPLTSITYNGTTYTPAEPTAPIPEDCFSFSAGAITEYLYADMNLIKNSSIGCLARDVNIPSTIDELEVTVIGNDAFNSNQLTSVTIPNTVTSIGDRAFLGNQLTSLTLPEGVANIGWFAFYANRLARIDIPDSMTYIEDNAFFLQNKWGGDVLRDYVEDVPYVWSNNPAEVQRLFDNIWYTQLHTQDLSNPNSFQNVIISENYEMGRDANNNGTVTDSLGGHLINPARTETAYASSTGQQLSAPITTIGQKTDGTKLTSYLAVESAILAPLDPYDITPTEQTAMDTGFAQYYHLGDQVTLSAPATLGGLSLLRPTSPHSLTLTSPVNTVDFVYGTPLSAVDFATPVGSSTNPTPNAVPSSVTPLLAGSTFTVSEATDCRSIQSASLVDASNFDAPLANYDTLGGLSFVLDCTTVGGQANVSFSLGGTINNLSGVKVYKQDSSDIVTDITDQVSLTTKQTATGARTVISYAITDGLALDDDGLANGTITDPIYVTMPSGTTVTLLGSGELAATGTNITMFATAGLVALTVGAIAVLRLYSMRNPRHARR